MLSGPRGNGKTALLRWFRREIEASDSDVDVVWLTPGEIPDLDRLATGVVPPSRFASLRPDTLSLSRRHRTIRLGAGVAGVDP